MDQYATYDDKTIIAGQLSPQDYRGSILSISDFQFLTHSIYNHPDYYGNHSNLLQNIITEMIPEKSNKLSIFTR